MLLISPRWSFFFWLKILIFFEMRWFSLSLFLCWLCTWCESLWNAALHLTWSHVLFTKSTTPHSHTKSIYTHSLRKSLLVLSCLPSDCLWKQMQDNPTDLCWQTHPNTQSFFCHRGNFTLISVVFMRRWRFLSPNAKLFSLCWPWDGLSTM